MNKSIEKFILRMLILFLVFVPFVLLGSAQTDKVSLERTVIYNINQDDSANVTISYKFETISENDIYLNIFIDNIIEVSKDLDNIKISSPDYSPDDQIIYYTEHNFSSIEEGFQRIKPKEYFHFMKENKGAGMWSHVFVIGFNPKLPPQNITYLDISYSIKNVIFPNLIKEAKVLRLLAPNSYELKLEGNNNSKIDIIKKNSNVIVNLPQDRYHYSQLMSPPNPPPATTVILGNAPSMTWFYPPDTPRISSIFVIYKIQEDSLVKTLDDTIISVDRSGNIALGLGIFSLVISFLIPLYQEKINKKQKQELREMLKRHDDKIDEMKEMMRPELNHDNELLKPE